MRPAAVILDFDGVVVDSLAAHLEAWRQAVGEVLRVPLPATDELAGHATRTIAHILCRRHGDSSLVPALIAAKERHLASRLESVPLIRGAKEFFDRLRHEGLPHGIASNSPRAFVEGTLAAIGLAAPAVLGNEDAARPKPAPDIFWECANRLRIHPKDRKKVLVFEDSAHGIKAAVDAGMTPIGVGPDAVKLQSAGAVATCLDLAEALECDLLTAF